MCLARYVLAATASASAVGLWCWAEIAEFVGEFGVEAGLEGSNLAVVGLAAAGAATITGSASATIAASTAVSASISSTAIATVRASAI